MKKFCAKTLSIQRDRTIPTAKTKGMEKKVYSRKFEDMCQRVCTTKCTNRKRKRSTTKSGLEDMRQRAPQLITNENGAQQNLQFDDKRQRESHIYKSAV